MKNSTIRSIAAICFVCIFSVLMCAFFVEETHAAQVASGTNSRKEQTVALQLQQGTCVVTVQSRDSWVYAQIQKRGYNKKIDPVNGNCVLSGIGEKKSFCVPIRTAGTYYLYLHGTKSSGISYSVSQYSPGGTLKNNVPYTGTSYGDNTSVVYYQISVPGPGGLRVTVNDSSYLYPGYSKVTLKKANNVISGEEHLIKGLGYSTVYGVSKGTYYIGVRSSSELYKITCSYSPFTPAKYGTAKITAPEIPRKRKTGGIIEPGNKQVRWYKIRLPKRSKKGEKKTLTIRTYNNNLNLDGGIKVNIRYNKLKNGKKTPKKKRTIMNNSSQTLKFGTWKNRERIIFIRVVGSRGDCGTYWIDWK